MVTYVSGQRGGVGKRLPFFKATFIELFDSSNYEHKSIKTFIKKLKSKYSALAV